MPCPSCFWWAVTQQCVLQRGRAEAGDCREQECSGGAASAEGRPVQVGTATVISFMCRVLRRKSPACCLLKTSVVHARP